jgi:hypothetical protein
MSGVQAAKCTYCDKVHTGRIETIERQTARTVSIETRPTPENIARCNGQSQSPLFSKLPPEIRNYIFSLTLLQYEDLSNPYKTHDYWYRPGHRAQRIVSTSLLQTCRLAWLEANHWPMAQATHTFWHDDYRRPEWTCKSHQQSGRILFPEDARASHFFRRLTSVQFSRVKHIQIVGQLYWLEGVINKSSIWSGVKNSEFDLDSFTVTVRHSDWWNWEYDELLVFNSDWLREMLLSPGATKISEFRLELETLESKVDQLRPILKDLESIGAVNEGEEERWKLVMPFEETTWSGPTNLGGEEHQVYKNHDKLDYRVVTMKWRRREPTKIEQRWQQEGSLLMLSDPTRARDEDERKSQDERSSVGESEAESADDFEDVDDEEFEEETDDEREESE